MNDQFVVELLYELGLMSSVALTLLGWRWIEKRNARLGSDADRLFPLISLCLLGLGLVLIYAPLSNASIVAHLGVPGIVVSYVPGVLFVLMACAVFAEWLYVTSPHYDFME